MVVAGQIVPMRISDGGGATGLLHYVPSVAEMGIVIGSVSFCLFVYILIEKNFDLSPIGRK
jgi:Ni/Fe-hydrogenase subunit HybB-like protein